MEVVRLFLSGFSMGEIAEKFSRSKQTVSAQKCAAMRKLDVHNDMDLVRYGGGAVWLHNRTSGEAPDGCLATIGIARPAARR